MEKTMTLKEFVDLCNNCDYDVNESPRDKDLSLKLANDFKTISEWEKENSDVDLKGKVPQDKIDRLIKKLMEENHEKENDAKTNLSFYLCLKAKGVTDSYRFNWDENVNANVNVWEPFSKWDPLCKKNCILSQKWHVLISLLALLDTAANDPNFKKYFKKFGGDEKDQITYGRIKELKYITFDDSKCQYLRFDDKLQKYKSFVMKEWIMKAINKEE